MGIALGAVLTLCACGSSGPGAALSPIIPPGPRVMSGCIVHHDLTLQGATIDGATGGIDVQSTATGPGFAPGAPCIPSMLETLVGDTVYAIPAIPAGDVLGCHLPIEDVYFAPGAGYKTGLVAATIECQQSGATGQGQRVWWGGVVSGILATPPPAPQETQGPLPNSNQVVCRILLTMRDGDPSQPVMELVEGTTQRVCHSFSILTRPEAITS
ncbi:MAG: hypothetical protein ACREQ5_18035, partial [Candidatus Dormibacteria bacterium]